jgi:hypothetical protein
MKTKKVPFTTFFLLLFVLVLSSTSVLAQLSQRTPQRRTTVSQSGTARGASILSSVLGTRDERQARRSGVIIAPTGPRCKRKK